MAPRVTPEAKKLTRSETRGLVPSTLAPSTAALIGSPLDSDGKKKVLGERRSLRAPVLRMSVAGGGEHRRSGDGDSLLDLRDTLGIEHLDHRVVVHALSRVG